MERGAVPLRLQPVAIHSAQGNRTGCHRKLKPVAASSHNLPFTYQRRLIMPIIDLQMQTISALDYELHS